MGGGGVGIYRDRDWDIYGYRGYEYKQIVVRFFCWVNGSGGGSFCFASVLRVCGGDVYWVSVSRELPPIGGDICGGDNWFGYDIPI